MKQQLKYCPMISLKETALRGIVVMLWNKSFNVDFFTKLQVECSNRDEAREIKHKLVKTEVMIKAKKLGLPESLYKQIVELVQPVGLQIQKWKMFHEAYLNDSTEDLDVAILKLLVWTSAGTIHYIKTAKVLVSCNVLDINKCYQLACLYCLKSEVVSLWKKLPEQKRKYFHDDEVISQMEEPHLQFCWPYILYEEHSKLHNIPGRLTIAIDTTFNQYVFEYSAMKGNMAATEYFFQLLTPEERNASLVSAIDGVLSNRNNNMYKYNDDFPKEKLSDVLCYLLSVMTPEEQMNFFKEHSCEVVPCFFDWHYLNYFLQITELMWTFLPESHYNDLLLNILMIIRISGYYFPRLFQEFFRRSPSEFRNVFVTAGYIFAEFFAEFLKNQDFETIKVVFGILEKRDRVRLVSSLRFFELFEVLMEEDNWHLIELCLQEATLAVKDSVRLKNTFSKFLSKSGKTHIKEKKWKRFFQLVYESTSKKRNSDVETWIRGKRLRLRE